MEELIGQEQFELEVLDRLNTFKLLKNIIFCGGTMLRLCYGLNRFSVDLDFWHVKEGHLKELFSKIRNCFSTYEIIDAADKFYTILFEIKDRRYPRALKIEIRKEIKKISVERSIAFSKFANTQVLLDTVSLKDMLTAKIDALIDRKEIRDAFDLEFLIRKGVSPKVPADKLEKAKQVILSFKKIDYTVKLGSLLEAKDRKYYSSENFKLLLTSLT